MDSSAIGSPASPTLAARGRITSTRDPYRLAMYVLLLITIGRIHQHFSFLSALHPAQLVVAIALAYGLANRQAVNVRTLKQWPVRVMGALFLWACATAPFGLSLGGSASFALFTFSKIVLSALLLVVAVRSSADLKGLVWAYVLSCAVLVLFAWTVFDITAARGSAVTRLDDLYMYDANDIGLLFSIGIPLGLWLARASSGKARVTSLAIVVGMVATIARSGSRGGFLGLLAVGAALFFLVREVGWGKKVLLLAVGAGVLTVAAPPGYWEQMETISEPTEDYNWESYYGRKQTWERGIGYMLENPITGVGIDNFNRAEGTLTARAKRIRMGGGSGPNRWHAAHNSLVQVGAEMGLPGLLLWVSLLVGGFLSLYRRNKRLPQRWGAEEGSERQFLYLATVYLPVAFVGFAVTSFFLTFAYLEPIYILAAFTAATLYLLRRLVVRERHRTGTARASSGRLASQGRSRSDPGPGNPWRR